MSRIRGPQESKCLRTEAGTENVRNGAALLAAGASRRGGLTTAFGAGLGTLDTGPTAFGAGLDCGLTTAFGAGLGTVLDGIRLTAAFGAGLFRCATGEELALGPTQEAPGRNKPEENSGMALPI